MCHPRQRITRSINGLSRVDMLEILVISFIATALIMVLTALAWGKSSGDPKLDKCMAAVEYATKSVATVNAHVRMMTSDVTAGRLNSAQLDARIQLVDEILAESIGNYKVACDNILTPALMNYRQAVEGFLVRTIIMVDTLQRTVAAIEREK